MGFCSHACGSWRNARLVKGSPTAMGQFVGEQLLLVNKDQRRAVDEVIYQREDERKEDDEGDDVGRFERDNNSRFLMRQGEF